MTEIPPPPDHPPPRYGASPIPPASPWTAPPQGEQFPVPQGQVTYATVPKNRQFHWWEALIGAFAAIVGNILFIGGWGTLGHAAGTLLFVYNAGWIVVPLLFKRWSYTIGYLVGVVGAIALGLVVVIYSCSSTYGNSNG